jgi:hypothetical protein
MKLTGMDTLSRLSFLAPTHNILPLKLACYILHDNIRHERDLRSLLSRRRPD